MDADKIVPTPEQFAQEMSALMVKYAKDEEAAAGAGEKLMCRTLRSLGYGEGVHAFTHRVTEW